MNRYFPKTHVSPHKSDYCSVCSNWETQIVSLKQSILMNAVGKILQILIIRYHIMTLFSFIYLIAKSRQPKQGWKTSTPQASNRSTVARSSPTGTKQKFKKLWNNSILCPPICHHILENLRSFFFDNNTGGCWGCSL